MGVDDRYGQLRGEDEAARVVELVAWSFGSPQLARTWVEAVGADNVRVLRGAGGEPESSLGLIAMGQWLGGRRVPAVGIAAVATAGASRGAGLSQELLRHALVEQRAAGVPLSLLYPASYALYRKNGYEVAGTHFVHRVAARDIDVRDRGLQVRPLGPGDQAAVRALRDTLAREGHGNLDRPERLWARMVRRPGAEATGFGVTSDTGALVGYVYLRQTPSGGAHPYDLDVVDVGALSVAAWRRILTLIRDHGSLGAVARWRGPLADPMTLLLAEEVHKVDTATHWMARLVDVDRALTARGYPRDVSAELHLDVADETLPDNAGRRVLVVAGGGAEVRPGGDGALRCGVHALAQLYTGFAPAAALARLGGLAGAEPTLELADRVFRGPAPWMNEAF